MPPLEQVREQIARYEHPLFDFSAREKNGKYVGMNDYVIEMFTHTPQSRV